MITVKIKVLDKSIPVPHYAHIGDAGFDLSSAVDCKIAPFERKKIPTGIKISIPDGYAGFVQPRSGIALKNGISMVNAPGLIDSGYRGEICAILINLDPHNVFNINKGDKICQMVIKKIDKIELEVVNELDSTSRGESGFGSTGK